LAFHQVVGWGCLSVSRFTKSSATLGLFVNGLFALVVAYFKLGADNFNQRVLGDTTDSIIVNQVRLIAKDDETHEILAEVELSQHRAF